jgi:hypothetical protein
MLFRGLGSTGGRRTRAGTFHGIAGLAVWAVGCLAMLCGVGAATAAPTAEELETSIAALELEVKEHLTTKAPGPLLLDGQKAAAIYPDTKDVPAARKRLKLIFETVLKAMKEDVDRKAAFDILVGTKDPELGPLLRPYLRQGNVKESDPLLLAAIRSAGALPCSENAEPLLTIYDKSKHMVATTAAMEALGAFRTVRSRREKILETLVTDVKRVKPGGRPGVRGGGGSGMGEDPGGTGSNNPSPGDPAARWGMLSPLLPKVCNQLTGQNIGSAEMWFLAWDDARRPADLFAADPEPSR